MTTIAKRVACWTLLVSGTISLRAAQPEEKGKSCRKTLEEFYAWYVPQALKDTGVNAVDIAIKQRGSAFAPELLSQLRDDSKAQAKASGQIVGLDFDPFLNSQDPQPAYIVSRVTERDGKCSAQVYGLSDGKKSAKPDVMPQLTLRGTQWVFANFHYGKSKISNDENLLSILRRLRLDRQKQSR